MNGILLICWDMDMYEYLRLIGVSLKYLLWSILWSEFSLLIFLFCWILGWNCRRLILSL